MKTKLFPFIVLIFSSLTVWAQVTAGQIDDFQDGTIQGWTEGALSPNPPTNISTGGPLGAGDNFLQNISSGILFASGGNMVMFNSAQWAGNYTAQSIIAIKFDAKVVGSTDLKLRVAFQKNAGPLTQISTTNAVDVTAGSGWTSVTIPISASDFTVLFGGTAATVLTGVNFMRILSSVTPSWTGDNVAATLQVDNIRASTTLGLEDQKLVDGFQIYPNPTSSKLNIILSNNINITTIEIFDVLGKMVYAQKMNNLFKPIDVTGWNSGVYLVKVANEISVQTKKFIKQ